MVENFLRIAPDCSGAILRRVFKNLPGIWCWHFTAYLSKGHEMPRIFAPSNHNESYQTTILYFLFVLALSNYGSGLFNYFFWQKSQVELITSGSAGTWPVLFPQHRRFPPRALFRRFPADITSWVRSFDSSCRACPRSPSAGVGLRWRAGIAVFCLFIDEIAIYCFLIDVVSLI